MSDNKIGRKYESELKTIYEKNGHLTPEIVVNTAKNPKSPLHSYFEWNDSKAADAWRIEQASHLIRHVKIKMVTSKGEEIPIRAYYNIASEQDEEEPVKNRIYVSFNDVKNDKNRREQVIQYAWRELQFWKQRYKIYREFEKIVEIIESTQI
jgi:hypothetical protein